MMKRMWMVLAVTAALSACGGGVGGVSGSGTGSGSGGSTATAATLSGKVVDGYLQGAEVCLDTNADKACDTAKAITDANGSYNLIYTLTAEQLASAHVLVIVPETAKDADDGGKTLKEAGKAAFELLAPAAKPQVVSPLTTLVSERMISHRQSLADAELSVVTTLQLGDEAVLLGANASLVVANDVKHKQLAQIAAVLLGEVKKILGTTVASQPSVISPAVQQRIEVDAVRDMLRTIVETQQLGLLGDSKKVDPAKVQALLSGQLASKVANLRVASYLADKSKALAGAPVTFNVSQLVGQTLYFTSVIAEGAKVIVCPFSIGRRQLTSDCMSGFKEDSQWEPEGLLAYDEITRQGWAPSSERTSFSLVQDTARTFYLYEPARLNLFSMTLRVDEPSSPSDLFKGMNFSATDLLYPLTLTANADTPYFYIYQNGGSSWCGSGSCSTLDEFMEYYKDGSGNVYQPSEGAALRIAFNGKKLALYEQASTLRRLPAEGDWVITTYGDVTLLQMTIPAEFQSLEGTQVGVYLSLVGYQGKVTPVMRLPRFESGYTMQMLNASAFEKVRQFYKLPALPQ